MAGQLYLTGYRKNKTATILFTLQDRGTEDFESTPVGFVAADTQVSIDGAAFANSNAVPTHIGNGMYQLVLTAAEMNGDRIAITIVDAAAKAWEDFAIIINTQAGVAFARDLLLEAISTIEADTPGDRTLYTAIAKSVNKIARNAGTLEIYRTNGTTIHATQAISTDPNNQPIDELAGTT